MHKNIYKQASSFLVISITLTFISFTLQGCEDKKHEEPIHIENTTEILKHTDKKIQKDPLQDVLILSNDKNITHQLTLSEKKLSFLHLNQPIVVINLFNASSPACLSEILSLSKIQERYKKKLFIASILTKKHEEISSLNSFLQKHKIDYFISKNANNRHFIKQLLQSFNLNSNSKLPLTIIYKNGIHYSHFEGPVPIEMINYDIQKAIKK